MSVVAHYCEQCGKQVRYRDGRYVHRDRLTLHDHEGRNVVHAELPEKPSATNREAGT